MWPATGTMMTLDAAVMGSVDAGTTPAVSTPPRSNPSDWLQYGVSERDSVMTSGGDANAKKIMFGLRRPARPTSHAPPG